METAQLKAVLESLLLAAGEPVPASRLAKVCDDEPIDEVKKALDELAREYTEQRRGLTIEQVAGGYQMRTALENAPYVRRLLATRQSRLSRPLLETLAIIAYRQPITRAEIEQIRGVDCGGVLDTLLTRRLIRVAGLKAMPGRPLLYATTAEFLETFGLKSLKALPQIEGVDTLAGRASPEAVLEEQIEGESTQKQESDDFGLEPEPAADDRLAEYPAAKKESTQNDASDNQASDRSPERSETEGFAPNEAAGTEHHEAAGGERTQPAAVSQGQSSFAIDASADAALPGASELSTTLPTGSDDNVSATRRD